MIFRNDFRCEYEAWTGRAEEQKVRTHRANSAAGHEERPGKELRQRAPVACGLFAPLASSKVVGLRGKLLTRKRPDEYE